MSRLTGHLRRTLIVGVLLLVPVVVTFIILRFLFTTIDGLLGPAIEEVFGTSIPGLGVIGLLVLVYLVGLLGRNVMGRRVLNAGQRALLRVPLIRTVYGPAKQLIESFSGGGGTGFKRVVMLEYPRSEAWTIGFLTSITQDETGRRLAVVYIPTAPTPNSGWITLLPLAEVYDTDLTVPEAMQLVLSGGIVAPDQINRVRSS